MPSAVSCTGISSSTVTRCTTVRGERNSVITLSACDLIGPTLARPASSPLTLRNCAIRPVGGASSTTASYVDGMAVAGVALHGLVDLAGEQHVAHPGRDRRRELDDPEPVQRLPGPAELVVHRRGTPAAPTRRPRAARARRRGARRAGSGTGRWRSGAPRRAAGRRRTSGRCPGGPRPRRAGRRGPRRPATGPARRRRWTCRSRPCRSPRAAGRPASRVRRAPRPRCRSRSQRRTCPLSPGGGAGPTGRGRCRG